MADRAGAGRSRLPTRRRAVACGAGVVLAWLTPRDIHGQRAPADRPAAGDLLVRVGDWSLTPLAPGDIVAGGKPVMAWPMSPVDRVARSGSRLNRILLVRLDLAAFSDATRGRTADGIAAFSAVCTHTGCEVGEFLADEQQLYCECHQSTFDPRDGAKVTDGPAPRPLPALPVGVADGRLVVTAPFTSRPGFEQG